MQLNLFREIIVDNFAGGGGASTGIELATGLSVDIAINHDPSAILMHKTNHPDTEHYCESVWDVDPVKAVRGRKVGLAWFSPDCKAKGSKPKDSNIRGLAWIAVKWAVAVKPRIIMLENVEEFKTWGPLDKNGYPDKSKEGSTFQSFVKSLKALGYEVQFKYGWSFAKLSEKTKSIIAEMDIDQSVFTISRRGAKFIISNENEEENENTNEEEKEKKTSYKWVCPGCKLIIRSTKPEINVICGDCKEKLEVEE